MHGKFTVNECILYLTPFQSYSYFCTKVCTWDDYIWDYKNGVKPRVDQNIAQCQGY